MNPKKTANAGVLEELFVSRGYYFEQEVDRQERETTIFLLYWLFPCIRKGRCGIFSWFLLGASVSH